MAGAHWFSFLITGSLVSQTQWILLSQTRSQGTPYSRARPPHWVYWDLLTGPKSSLWAVTGEGLVFWFYSYLLLGHGDTKALDWESQACSQHCSCHLSVMWPGVQEAVSVKVQSSSFGVHTSLMLPFASRIIWGTYSASQSLTFLIKNGGHTRMYLIGLLKVLREIIQLNNVAQSVDCGE